MKTRLFTRLSALAAGAAVALAGALSAIPAVHAASTYTLDQVGGTLQFNTVTAGGTIVAGTKPNGQHLSGTIMPMYGFGATKMTANVSVAVNDPSKLVKGDTIRIPLTYPQASESTIKYEYFRCTGAPYPELSVSCNPNEVVLSAKEGIDLLDHFTLNIPIVFQTSKSNSATTYTYVTNQFVGVGGQVYLIDTEPGADTSTPGTGSVAAVGDSNLASSVTQTDTRMSPFYNMRDMGLFNRILRGEYTNESAEVLGDNVVVTHVDASLGFSDPLIRFSFYYPVLAEREGDTDYFSYALHTVGYVAMDDVLTKVELPASTFANPEDVAKALKPGEYALLINTDGAVDVAVNYGPYYNNPLLTTPTASLPAVGTYGITSEERAKYAQLADGGYANMQAGLSVWFTPDNGDLSRAIVMTNYKYRIYPDGTMTQQTFTREGYYDPIGRVTGSAVQAGATVSYIANATAAEGLSGTGPAATSATVGSSVHVANQASWKRTGYDFDGWNTAPNGSGTAYAAGDSLTLPREGVALYAQWKAHPYNVYFNKNADDATGTTASLSSKPFGSTVTLTANGFKRTGYTFDGWNTQADGKGTVYKDKGAFTIPAQNTTLYAQWTLDDVIPGDQPQPDGYVKVTFVPGANGALSGETSYWVNSAKTVTVTAPTVKPNTGFVFSKWDKNLTQKFTANTTITAQYVALADSVPGDQPKPDGYVTVTFDKGANGSLSGETSYHVNPNAAVSLTAPTVTANEGYVFDKWSTSFEGVKFTADTTITAQYKAEELVEIYRMYDGVEHLYVNNATERDALVARGWKYEGVAFYTPKTSSTAVHRLFQPGTGDHHYTSTPEEIAALTSKHGWRDEGVLFYGDDQKRVELKRLFMAGLGKGEHLHTADANELEALTTKHGWELEGISFYVAKYGS